MDELKKQRRYNTGLAKVAVQCSADTFVIIQTSVCKQYNEIIYK